MTRKKRGLMLACVTAGIAALMLAFLLPERPASASETELLYFLE